jgi:hypothetical protein
VLCWRHVQARAQMSTMCPAYFECCCDQASLERSEDRHPHPKGVLQFDGMLERLAPGDRLIVSELSRLGRSLGQVIHIVDELVKRKIRFTAIKESIHFEGK